MTKYLLFFIFLTGVLWYVYYSSDDKLPSIENLTTHVIEEVKKEVNTPPPLRAKEESKQSSLTLSGVIEHTNRQRAANGLSPLSENQLLNNSATTKTADMFKQQYFAHDSPQRIGVSDLAEQSEYKFIVIGENLALGNFLNDEVLVQAWMDSPGHRANILNTNYTEIGVSVVKGTYEGKTTWLAVQHFGRPLSDCPSSPSDAADQQIERNKQRLNDLQVELEQRRKDMEQLKEKNEVDEYNRKAEEYNTVVEEYNRLAAETKQQIETYNTQVKNFNECAFGEK